MDERAEHALKRSLVVGIAHPYLDPPHAGTGRDDGDGLRILDPDALTWTPLRTAADGIPANDISESAPARMNSCKTGATARGLREPA